MTVYTPFTERVATCTYSWDPFAPESLTSALLRSTISLPESPAPCPASLCLLVHLLPKGVAPSSRKYRSSLRTGGRVQCVHMSKSSIMNTLSGSSL